MKTCKNCNETVVETNLMEEVCLKCQDLLQNEKQNKSTIAVKNVSFWKHAFNWKYYILPFIVGIITAYYFYFTGNDIFTITKNINTIIAIYAAVQLKSKNIKKFGMFLTVGIFSGIILFLTYLSSMYILTKTDENYKNRDNAISNILKLNNKMPMILNKDFKIIKYSSPDNKNITMHGQYINFTKNEILSGYANNIKQFQDEMLNVEQQTSCSDTKLKYLFSIGIQFNIEYIGNDNNSIGIIRLNDENCRSYY